MEDGHAHRLTEEETLGTGCVDTVAAGMTEVREYGSQAHTTRSSKPAHAAAWWSPYGHSVQYTRAAVIMCSMGDSTPTHWQLSVVRVEYGWRRAVSTQHV